MSFQIGDTVIHGTYGMGEIVHIEEKHIHNRLTNCYVVRTPDLTIWIPISELDQHSLRQPVSPEEFVKLFPILTGPGQQLLEDRMQRKDQLMGLLRDGQLGSICRLVRDLTQFQRSTRLNDIEKSILSRAIKSLLTEWSYALGVPPSEAQQHLNRLLEQPTQ